MSPLTSSVAIVLENLTSACAKMSVKIHTENFIFSLIKII